MWEGNRVSIGLSSGFIEPLESTGVGMITAGITQLCNAIREEYVTQLDIDYFNLQLSIIYEDCADFVSMHYFENKRDTPFWNFVKSKFYITDRMEHYINRMKDPDQPLPYAGHWNSMFIGTNWTTWLAQMDFKIAERNTNFTKEDARLILIEEYILKEKYKSLHGVIHSAEIDRLREQFNLK